MADAKISALTDGTIPASTDASPWARSGGTTVKLTWAELLTQMPGYEIGYNQITANVNVTSSTESSGTTVLTASAYTFDGLPVIAEFWASDLAGPSGTGLYCVLSLFEGSTQICRLGYVTLSTAGQMQVPFHAKYRFTPTAASHTYKVTGHVISSGTGVVTANSGGTSTPPPAFLRFTKV